MIFPVIMKYDDMSRFFLKIGDPKSPWLFQY